MLERKYSDLEAEVQTTLCGLDGDATSGALESLLRAAAALADSPREQLAAAIDQQAAQLAEWDPVAAERALNMLRILSERLARARCEARMAGLLSAALVRAADALSGQFEVGRG